MTFVLIYGPPAVGKLTVATELAKLSGYKVFHNHVSVDLAETFFERGTPSFGRVVHELRRLIFEEAAKGGVNLIFTYAYAHGVDDPEIAWMITAVEQHSGCVQLVHLTCASDTLQQRVASASRRAFGKIVDAEFLGQLLETYDLFTPYPPRPSLQLDTTHTPPFETAAAIATHLKNL